MLISTNVLLPRKRLTLILPRRQMDQAVLLAKTTRMMRIVRKMTIKARKKTPSHWIHPTLLKASQLPKRVHVSRSSIWEHLPMKNLRSMIFHVCTTVHILHLVDQETETCSEITYMILETFLMSIRSGKPVEHPSLIAITPNTQSTV